MIVIRNGQIALEWYSGDVTRAHNHNIFSVTKTVVSALAGIAIDQKVISGIDETLGDLYPEVSDPEMEEASLENLLTMRSGLPQSRGNFLSGPEKELFDRLHASTNRLKSIFELPMNGTPGSKFLYSNIDPQLVLSAVERKTDQNGLAFAQSTLFKALEFENAEWVYADKAGNLPGGYGLRLRAIDLAKLGQLFLQNGEWNRQQVISSEWVQAATTNQTESGYGYFWWIVRSPEGQKAYAAKGVRGQQLFVDPSHKLVFAVTSDLPPKRVSEIMKQLNERLMLAVEKSSDALPEASEENRKLEKELGKASDYEPTQRKGLIPARLPRVP
tara:strand:+ start:2885 stop:3871 length:987 start_codon:yes stop_codon:yes gene_type:complete